MRNEHGKFVTAQRGRVAQGLEEPLSKLAALWFCSRRLPETTQRVRIDPASGTDRSHEERQHQQRWSILGRFREPPAAIP